MAYKNRKKNYPLYGSVRFSDAKELIKLTLSEGREKVAISYLGANGERVRKTFWDSAVAVRSVGCELISLGVTEKRVALIGEPSAEWIYSFLALLCVGAVAVPIDGGMSPSEIASAVRRVNAEFIIYSSEIEGKISELLERSVVPHTLIAMGRLPGAISKLAREKNVSLIPFSALQSEGAKKLAEGDLSFDRYEIDDNRIAAIFFTKKAASGERRAVMLSSKNIASAVELWLYNVKLGERTALTLLPHTVSGAVMNIVAHYAAQAELYIPRSADPAELSELRPTHLILSGEAVDAAVSYMRSALEGARGFASLGFRTALSSALRKIGIDMRRVIFGSDVLGRLGGKLDMILCDRRELSAESEEFLETVGITPVCYFAEPECTGIITSNRNEYREKGSYGMPIVGGLVKIASPGEGGEICFKGVNVMLGYFGDEAATDAVFDSDGYYMTGVFGRVLHNEDETWLYPYEKGQV